MTPEQRLKRAVVAAAKAEDRLATARTELRAAIVEARRAGMTLEGIGAILGVTRQRVRQIVRDAGLR